MKHIVGTVLFFIFPNWFLGQTTPQTFSETTIELSAEQLAAPGLEDELEHLLENRKGHLNNLNGNDFQELLIRGFITEWQVEQLLLYRKLMGPLIHIYELQAISGWTPETIRKIIPFVTLFANSSNGNRSFQVEESNSQIIIRTSGWRLSQVSGRSKDPSWLGDEHRVFLQYRWGMNDWQAGITAEKDPGEAIWEKGESKGFDFYSAHLFLKKNGLLQTLAIGDFTVNMGQGLIQWQSLAFRKSPEISWAKRQGPVFKPHRSASEFGFHRGLGIQLQQGNWSCWAFLSKRMLTANLILDSAANPIGVSSLNSSGYHRTQSELVDKNCLGLFSEGFRVASVIGPLKFGLNTVRYHFSVPFLPGGHPYQLYQFTGSYLSNWSTDFSITRKNYHVYGELAIDNNGSPAFITGLMVSGDPKLDLSLIVRALSSPYHSLYSNAFTEGTRPTNERGIFLGGNLRPDHRLKIDAFIDCYQFPWLRYQISKPRAFGLDRLLQLSFKPDKETELLVRIKQENKPRDSQDSLENDSAGPALNSLEQYVQKGIRIHLSRKLSTALELRIRLETTEIRLLAVNENYTTIAKRENGFLCFAELKWNPRNWMTPTQFRAQYFDTDSYNSRIYAYEPDPGSRFSIPASYGRGALFMVSTEGRLTPNLSLGAKVTISRNTIDKGWLPVLKTYLSMNFGGQEKPKKNRLN